MAISKVVYNTENGEQTLIDLTNDSVTPETLAIGVTAHNARGEEIVGTMAVLELEQVYPVGAIYMSTVSTSPATLFGFGTWERIQDTFLLAAGSTYAAGATGGAATHTLTVSEMPAHKHGVKSGSANGNNSGIWAWTDHQVPANDAAANYRYLDAMNNEGGGKAHNNMPPYLAVYVWRRTA